MPDAPVPNAAGVRVLDHAVLRVAAWPVEITDAFAAPDLAGAARRVLADLDARAHGPAGGSAGGPGDGADLGSGAQAVADRIHALVPLVTDRATRRWLLDVRRAVVDPDRPVPTVPVAAGAAVAALPDGPALLDAIGSVAGPRAETESRRAAFVEAFAAELDRSRHALRTLGASDRFRTALAIAEPSVLVRWDATRPKPLSDKARVRRLEATVLHFAMRACGRPTPNGGWAGVTVVEPEDGSIPPAGSPGPPGAESIRVDEAPRAVHVSVDLGPFAAVLDAWARTLGASSDHPLQREPTLRDEWVPGAPSGDPDARSHQWVYLRRDTTPCTFAALPTVPVLREAMADWPLGAIATPSALYERLGAANGRAVVEHLLASGVLRSALRLPSFAPSTAAALAAVTPLLPEPLASTWSATLAALDTETAALAAAFLADDVDAVVRHRDVAVAAVSELTRSAGLGDTPDRGVVHVDLQVPWRATWTAAGRAAIGRALDDVFAFHAADGSAEAYRRVMAERVEATLTAGATDVLAGVASTHAGWVTPPPTVATRADLLRTVGVDPTPAESRWIAHLDAATTTSSATHVLPLDGAGADDPAVPDPGPTGSFIVAPVGSTVWARWGRPQPGMFLTRFAPLLTAEGRGGAPALASLATALRRLPARRIVGADAPNLNAALRPPLDGVDPWGWGLDGERTDAGIGDADATDEGPMVVDPDGAASVPVYDSAAVIGSTDPVTRFVRTAAMAHGWELAAWGFPVLDAELDRWPGLPRLVLPSHRPAGGGATTVLTGRRWVIGGEVLGRIRDEADEADRYLAWRREVDRRDIPARVVVRWDLVPDARELVLMTENPLALRALLDRLPDGPATLVLTELPEPIADWPVVGPDGHHLSELAVTWVRRSVELDPSVFPGAVVPPSFLALLDVVDVAPLGSGGPDADDPATGAAVRSTLAALLDELVDPAERADVALAAAAWLTRVADAQDPDGAGAGHEPPTTGGDPGSDRLRADLRSLRAAFDADVRSASTDDRAAPVTRTQLVARLGHVAAITRWGEGPHRLRREAALWHDLASP